MAFAAFRRVGAGEPIPLELGDRGALACREGWTIVFRTVTRGPPTVWIGAEALPPARFSRLGDDVACEFERLIDMWAGRTEVTLEDDGHQERLRLDIAPSDSKLGPGAWDDMIRELSELSRSLPWGVSPGAAAGSMTRDALATVHPSIVEHELPALQRLLARLIAEPPTRTLRIRTIRPLDISRGADLRTVSWLARHPLELAGLRGELPEGIEANPRLRVDQPDTVTSFDHPVTRYIAHLLERVRRRLETSAASLSQSAGHGVPDENTRAYALRLAGDVRRGAEAVTTALASPLFRAVKPEPLSDAVLQSLPDHPLWAAIHRSGRRLLEPGLAFAPGESLYSALKHSYDLFELMVLYRLVREVDKALGGAGWTLVKAGKIERLPHEDRPRDRARWVWHGPDGEAVCLIYQAWFGSAQKPVDDRPYVSITAQGVPDFVLERRRPDAPPSWLILDAKFRSGRQSVLDALADMHRYRDALRLEGQPCDGAYIVVPALQPNAALYGRQDYRRTHQLGALVVYDEGWATPVLQWLQANLTPQSFGT